MRKVLLRGISVAFLANLVLVPAAFAQPGLNNEPWSPAVVDRAGLAVYMHEDSTGQLGSGGTSGDVTQLICGAGGGGSSTAGATGNSSCVIFNNSNGGVNSGQNSNGSQSAHSSTQSQTNNTNSMSSALGLLVPSGQ